MQASRCSDEHVKAVLRPQTVLVESLGMQHWLNMQLASTTGIAMNLQFPMPTRFMWEVARTLLGEELVPQQSTYKREVLTWRIYRLINSGRFIEQPECEALHQYFQRVGNEQGRHLDLDQFELSRSIADVFEQYMLYRPDWLASWESGASVFSDHNGKSHESWQAHIWRALVEEEPLHPAKLHRMAIDKLAALEANQRSLLPQHIYVFALNTMAPQLVEFFNALGSYCDIHIFHLNPCMDYWGDVQSDKALARQAQLTRWLDEQSHNPMLANMGQQGRDLFNLLQQQPVFEISAFETPRPRNGIEGAAEKDTLLTQVQQAIFEGASVPSEHCETSDDDSVVVVKAHSPLRELQALHDHLLDACEQDPSLSPQDILVMCPAIEDYAPYISSVFDTHASGGSAEVRLPCSVADRAPLDSIQEVAMFMRLLELPDSRFEVSAIIEYLRVDAIRQHFNFKEEELGLVEQWLSAANIRWGLDAQHQQLLLVNEEDSALQRDGIYSWSWGLERLLLGFLHTDENVLFDGVYTVPDVEGGKAESLGKLCWLLEQLQAHRQSLQRDRTIEGWQVYLHSLKQSVFGDMQDAPKAASKIDKAIADLYTHLSMAAYDETISLAVLRTAINRSFTQPDAINQFMTGQITFCSMLPMRSIPFKMIAMLGLNDGDFPRPSSVMSIDLMSYAQKRLGDRSRRGDDRYLFLEALISARQKLYLSYQANQVKDNSERQPSLVLREFCDYVKARFTPHESVSATPYKAYQLPLHAYSTSHYQAERHDVIQSYDQGWCRLAEALHTSAERALSTDTDWALDEMAVESVSVEELQRAFADPLKYFANHRLGLYLEQPAPLLDDIEPFTVDRLTRYRFLHDAIASELAHETDDAFVEAYFASGDIPRTSITQQVVADWQTQAQVLLAQIADAPQQIQSISALIDGVAINGRTVLVDADENAEVLNTLHWHISELRPKHHFKHRIEQLICSVNSQRTVGGKAFFIADNKGQINIRQVDYLPITPQEASEQLHSILAEYQQIVRSPSFSFVDLGEVLHKQVPFEDSASLWGAVEKLCRPQMMGMSLADSPYWHWFNPTQDLPDFSQLQKIHALYSPIFSAVVNVKAKRGGA